jgi:hypothetical protein
MEPTPRDWVENEIGLMRATHFKVMRFEQQRDAGRLRFCWSAGMMLDEIENDRDKARAFDVIAIEEEAHGDFDATKLIDLVTRDEDGKSISRNQRKIYAGVACWFHQICDADEEEVGLRLAREVGNLKQIANAYQDWANEYGVPGATFGCKALPTAPEPSSVKSAAVEQIVSDQIVVEASEPSLDKPRKKISLTRP